MKRERRERELRPAPARPAIRLLPPEPPRHVAFPGSAPDAPELAQPVSHIARRRMLSSAPEHEVDLEELELLDEPQGGLRAIMTPPGDPTWQPPSLAPVAMEARPAPALRLVAPTMTVVPEAPARGSSLRVALVGLACGIVALAVAVGGAGVLGSPRPPTPPVRVAASVVRDAPVEASATPAPAPPAPAAPEPAAAPASSVAVVDVAALPHAHDGTIVGAHGHRLWVDGRLVDGFSVVVACGKHNVQVGSAGTPHDVNVPCGDVVTVGP